MQSQQGNQEQNGNQTQGFDSNGRRTIHVNKRPGFDRGNRNNRAPAKPKGHDAKLAEWQLEGASVDMFTTAGERVVGKLIARDKFTVTVEASGHQTIYYKHAIESIRKAV